MISAALPNFMFSSASEMLLFLFSIVFATAAGVTAFLLVSSGNIKNFKNAILPAPCITQLPLVTPDGTVVNSKEELEAHLEVLESRLLEKVSEIESSKSRVDEAKESIDRLNSTQEQVKKYYVKLKEEIKKSEDDCKNLQHQIDDYRTRRVELEKEMKKSEAYYKELLSAVKGDESMDSAPISSRTSLGSVHSSVSSYYDSTPHEGQEEPPADHRKLKAKSRKTDEKSTAESCSSFHASTSKDIIQKRHDSNHSPPAPASKSCNEVATKKPSDSSIRESRKDVSRETSNLSLEKKEELSRTSAKIHKHSKLKAEKINFCCCGSVKCGGKCSLAKCMKTRLHTPSDIFSAGLLDKANVITGKMSCSKDSSQTRAKSEEMRTRKPLSLRSANRFS